MTDANPTSGAAQTRRWFRRPWVRIAAAVLLVVGGVWANHLSERAKGLREIEKRLDVLRAMGVAVTPAELAAKYPDPPPEKDATDLLRPSWMQLRGADGWIRHEIASDHRKRLTAGTISKAEKDAIRAFAASSMANELRHSADLLGSAWTGSGFPECVTNNWRYPPLWGLSLANALQKMALVAGEAGSADTAWNELRRSVALIDTVRSETTRGHYSFRQSQTRSVRVLERLLSVSGVSEPNLEKLNQLYSDERPRGFYQSEVFRLVERIVGIESVRTSSPLRREFRRGHSAWEAKLINGLAALFPGTMQDDFSDGEFVEVLDFSIRELVALEASPWKSIKRFESIEADVESLVRGREAGGYTSAILLNPNTWELLEDLEHRSFVRLGKSALAIERHRLAHAGSLPESLAELVPAYLPEVPLDLFDGQSLRYRKLPKGYVVYSIGRDLSDDGGKEPPADPKPDDRHDLTFTVEWPE